MERHSTPLWLAICLACASCAIEFGNSGASLTIRLGGAVPPAALSDYDASLNAGTALDGATWLSKCHWKPNPRSASEFYGSSNWTSLVKEFTDPHSGSLVDLSGTERPGTGPWTRGAYQ